MLLVKVSSPYRVVNTLLVNYKKQSGNADTYFLGYLVSSSKRRDSSQHSKLQLHASCAAPPNLNLPQLIPLL